MSQIIVIGCGHRREQLTSEAAKALESAEKVLLHTRRCGLGDELAEKGVAFETLDALYETAEDFDEHARLAAQAVLEASEQGSVAYAVFDVRDRSVSELLRLAGANARVIAGPPVEEGLWAYADGATDCWAAAEWETCVLHADRNAMIRELDSRELASDVKLLLMDCYPEESPIYVRAGDGEIVRTTLVELDRLPAYDHRLCALVPAQRDLTKLERYGFDDLNRVIAILRAPGGCPWDRKQTHATLRTNLVEEAYEAVDAIDREDMDAFYDELGDVLLQIVLHAEIAREHGEFTIRDVTSAIAHKMIFRHQHVFGSAKADTADEVLDLWQKVKKAERGQSTQTEVLRSVTKSLPALMRAEKVQKRAADVGFDWENARAAFYKIGEETEELSRAVDGAAGVEEEAGDLLFAVVNVLRLLKVDPEIALNRATNKFIARFAEMERLILDDDRRPAEMTLAEMDAYWDRVKLSENA